MATHVIGKQEFLITFDRNREVNAILDDLSLLYNRKITAVIDRIFSEIAPGEQQYIRIDRLEIDLGNIDARHLERDIIQRVSEKLAISLKEKLSILNGSKVVLPAVSGHSELLQHYLLYGSLPWWSATNTPDIEHLLKEALDEQPAALLTVLKQTGRYSYARKRLAFGFGRESVWAVIQLLEPAHKQTIQLYADELLVVHQDKPVVKADTGHYEKLTLEFILTYLLADKGSSFNEKMMLKSIVRQLAARYNIAYNHLIARLAEGAKAIAWPSSARHTLPFVIQEIYEEEYLALSTTPVETTSREQMKAKEEEKLLRHFLTYGTIPWESRQAGKSEIQSLLDFYLQHSPGLVGTWISKSADKTKTAQTISTYLTDKQLNRLVEILQPSEAGFIILYTQTLQQAQHAKSVASVSQDRFSQGVWEIVFLYLIGNRGTLFNTRSFLKHNIVTLAGKYGISYARLLEELSTAAVQLHGFGGGDRYTFASLLQTLKEEHAKENTGRDITPQPLTAEAFYETDGIETPARLDILAHLLLHGNLPWWISSDRMKTPLQPEEWLLQAIKHLPKETEKMLVHHGINNAFIEKIASFNETTVMKIVEWLEPAEAGVILLYSSVVEKTKENPDSVHLPRERFHKIKWQVILGYLLNDRGSKFNTKSFIKATISKYASAFSMEYSAMLHIFSDSLGMLQPASQKKSLLLNVFTELADEEKKQPVTGDKQPLLVYDKSREHPKVIFFNLFESWLENKVSDRKIPVSLLLARWLVSKPGDIKKKLVKFASQKANVSWLVAQLLPEHSYPLIFWLAEGSQLLTPAFLEQLEALLKETAFSKIPAKKLRQFLFEHTLHLLGSGVRVPFSREIYIGELVKFLALKETASEGAVVFLLSSAIRRKEGLAPHPLKEDIVHLQNKTKTKEVLAHVKDTSGADANNKGKDNERTPVRVDELPPEPDAVFIGNAGIVILWPFLGRLFDMLDLAERGKFISENAAYRAVHILQYMATGSENFPEYELVLNKILCGVAATKPLEVHVELTEAEKEKSVHLLNAVISQWAILKNTSVDGLRQSFLQRNGKLVNAGNTRTLTVEKKSFDILIDHIPWNIKTIKLSWMDKILYVQWRPTPP